MVYHIMSIINQFPLISHYFRIESLDHINIILIETHKLNIKCKKGSKMSLK